MSEGTKQIRLSKVVKEFNVGLSTVIDFLAKKGFKIDSNPNTKISEEIYDILVKEYQSEKVEKEKSRQIGLNLSSHETVSVENEANKVSKVIQEEKISEKEELIIRGNIDLDKKNTKTSTSINKEDKTPQKTTKKTISTKKSEIKTEDVEIAKKTDKPVKKIEKDVITKISEEENITKEIISQETNTENKPEEKSENPIGIKVLGKINLDSLKKKPSSKIKSSKDKDKIETEKNIEIKSSEETKSEEIAVTPKQDIKTEEKQEIIETNDLAEKHTDTEIAKIEIIENIPQEIEDKEIKEEKPVESDIILKSDEEVLNKETEKITEVDSEKITEVVVETDKPDNFLKTNYIKLNSLVVLDKIDLGSEPAKKEKNPVFSTAKGANKKKRTRIKKETKEPIDTKKPASQTNENWKNKQKTKNVKKTTKPAAPVIDDEQVQQHIKETLAKLTSSSKSKSAKHRRDKRQLISSQHQDEQLKIDQESKILKVTEFCTANDLANMMNIPVGNIINTCLNLGLFVSINQRLDAEVIEIVASEFEYKVEFVSADVQDAIGEETNDNPEDLVPRAPIVTVMGHVDHGKTSLLDYIRKSNVIAGEAGGITQHIGAYEFVLENGKKITFLDTPGHEAFTAMRARGAKITDVAIIIIAADDSVMPQTKEAINHAMAAGVPMVFAINKIDKPNANPDKIKEELARMNILVEDWDGKYQSQEISAKKGVNVDLLLEKVLLEAELMDLKGNPNRPALGTVIESSLDKGRGYITKVLVQNGSLKIGDIVLAGYHYGRVKAMYNERNQKVDVAGPSTPVLLLGLNGAPQAGDRFNVMSDEKETKAIANKRMQLQREQGLRTQKHITLDEIGRRIAIGDFKELNVIVKGDVDGSVEALSDSILKLSSGEVQVNVIHKSVGAVTESDVLLASASNAVIIGFQVRPTVNARKLAEQEQIDIRLYSIIYSAINELKAAIEGMLSPDIEEKITGNIEIREVFKISKVGSVAGCIVLDGKLNKSTNIRVIRDGIVVYSGNLSSLKRFKDDVKEVQSGYECGLSIHNFNDIKVGDIIEGYEEVEVKRKL